MTGVTPAEGSEGPLSAAERQRRRRARLKAQRELERREAEMAPLRLAMAAEAERQLGEIEAALGDAHRGLPVAERVAEGAKALILRLYGVPLVRMAERAAMPTAELARQLGCTGIEAARLQQEADREVMDRLWGKAPQAARGDQAAPVVVNLVATPGLAAQLKIQADQGLGEGDGA
ncbi:hypothetical protein [Rubritepida flocculans]|uniref:hypothetical protein n=1 Tax=Rubritepida flocculans TaxID=182403 RepID=UPI0012EBEA02|nr:hypothetical protein [Rubritepida flocculans]